MDCMSCLGRLVQLSAMEAEHCEMLVIAFGTRETMASCTRVKLPGLAGLPYALYVYMPDLFGDLLANVYCNWQQNGRIGSDAMAEKRPKWGR